MRRREFIGVLGGMAAWPLTGQAQQRLSQIGILLIGGPEPMGPFYEALRHRGYIEGRNIQFVVRSAEGDANRLPELATDLVRAKVDIIVASLTPSAIAAKNATHEIPIVMAPVGDPVGTGLVASLARPGGNVTGVSSSSPELGSKLLDVVREVLPKASVSRSWVLRPIRSARHSPSEFDGMRKPCTSIPDRSWFAERKNWMTRLRP